MTQIEDLPNKLDFKNINTRKNVNFGRNAAVMPITGAVNKV